MKVSINSVHFKADRKLELFIQEKLEKLDNFYDGIIGSEVMLKVENTESRDNKIAEIRLAIRGNDLYARKQSKTFEEAADSAVDALKKQLTRYKEKIRRV
ncbi:MAG: ribosome-associated translation inhibitor RaiA [Bacteroidetes bacterium]|nr:ribosome-associated translation inhibitor RaiA [Bacteroidota bacterium]